MKHGIVTHNTYQTIISAIESGSKKVLIVCPTSAKLNWERELHYMQEYDTAVVSGSKYKTAKYTIINFDILKNFHTLKGEEQDGIPPSRDLVNSKFDLCIIDEAHNLRNHKSIRGAIMRELCVDYGIEKTWLLTGTPVANRPMDFYNLLSLIKSPIVKDWKHYVTRYCEGKQITTKTKGGKLKKIWLTDGASNLDELSMKSRNILLRRLTHEFSDMPDKTITPLYFDMDKNQESEYYSLWDTYLEERKKLKKRGKVEKELVELSLLRRFIANETIPKTIELVDEIINEGNKVVIFTCFTDEIKTLSEYYGKNCVTHYGEMNNTEKQKSVDRFQDEGGPMVFIGNIISAGVAITLTRAHYMVFNSFDWVPGNIEQCEFRCYRIGQKNNVKIYYNLFNDTIVTRMWETIKYKQSIIDTILNNSTANETNYIEDAIDYITKNENE
jgi:SWI/SNF-related matrix-associated actin-dependent regulator 1 of chromatin subfamily A